MIFRDRDNNVIYTELKAGYHGYWQEPQGNLKAPLEHIPSCPLNHAQLQLAMGMYLSSGNVPVAATKAYVIQVESQGVFLFELQQWAVDAIKQLMPL